MSLTDLFRRAKARGRSVQELQREAQAATPRKLGLPTNWRDRERGVVLRGPDAPVITPTQSEIDLYSDTGVEVCGACKSFKVDDAARDKIIAEKFADRLVFENEWKLKYLGVPVEHLGLCSQSNGDLAVTIVSKACDAFVPREGHAGRWRL